MDQPRPSRGDPEGGGDRLPVALLGRSGPAFELFLDDLPGRQLLDGADEVVAIGHRQLKPLLVDDHQVGPLVVSGDRRIFQDHHNLLPLLVEPERRPLGEDVQVVGGLGVRVVVAVRESGAEQDLVLDVSHLDPERPARVVERAVELEDPIEVLLHVAHERLLGLVGGRRDQVVGQPDQAPAEDRPEQECRHHDRHRPLARRLDREHLVVRGDPAVDDRHREQQRHRRRVRQGRRHGQGEHHGDLPRPDAHVGGLGHDDDQHEDAREHQQCQRERLGHLPHDVSGKDSGRVAAKQSVHFGSPAGLPGRPCPGSIAS